MEVERIYFDMDDVLVDFTHGVREICGLEIKGEHAVSDDILFDGIRKNGHFYQLVKPIIGSLELFSDLRKEYSDKVEVLTAIPKPSRNLPMLGEEKKAWIRKYLGGDVMVNIVYRREKVNFVKNKGSILIDDNEDNIDAWEHAGGTGVLFTDAKTVRKTIDILLSKQCSAI